MCGQVRERVFLKNSCRLSQNAYVWESVHMQVDLECVRIRRLVFREILQL